MKRRDFLGITAVGVAGLACPREAAAGAVSRATLAHPHLLDVLHNEQIVAEIGRRYRESVPAEDDAQVLETAILSNYDRDAILGMFDECETWHVVERAMAQRKGVILVSGHLGNWELSGAYITDMSSISNTRTALGGITSPLPRAP